MFFFLNFSNERLFFKQAKTFSLTTQLHSSGEVQFLSYVDMIDVQRTFTRAKIEIIYHEFKAVYTTLINIESAEKSCIDCANIFHWPHLSY